MVAGLTIGILALALLTRSWLVLLALVVPGPCLLYWAKGRLAILGARLAGARRGILVTSDSPHWREHIERRWLPALEGGLTVLDWSERRRWRRSWAVRVVEHFCGERDFNPSVILFRGLRHPLVFRFHLAFREAKHGNRADLERLEGQLFEATAGWRGEPPEMD